MLTVLILDDAGTIAWARAGLENPTLDPELIRREVPSGLNCTNLVADPGFTDGVANLLNDTLDYFAVVVYWFLEGRPTPRMDIDGNGVPCETRFPADVVGRVWAGGWMS